MKQNYRYWVTIILFFSVILSFLLFFLISPSEKYSLWERRNLAKLNQPTLESVSSGHYMKELENYSMDHFPLRDDFRSLKAYVSTYLLRKKDNNHYYYADGHLAKLEYPLNTSRFGNNLSVLESIYREYISDTDCVSYLAVVPDKNYFLSASHGYPKIDYEDMISQIKASLTDSSYIDLTSLLSIEDYYRTDQHWKQECLIPVAKRLSSSMGNQCDCSFKEQIFELPFYGTYYGQAALKLAPDEIHFLTNDCLEQALVTSYSSGSPKESVLYNFEKAYGKDAYELFLSGSEPLLVIDNPTSCNDKELIIFRDSYASSLAPLLIPDYSRITLIDLRYMRKELIPSFVTFDKQDVLFLYSTLILNNTISLS